MQPLAMREPVACVRATFESNRVLTLTASSGNASGAMKSGDARSDYVVVRDDQIGARTKYQALLFVGGEIAGNRVLLVDKEVRMLRFLGHGFAMVDHILVQRSKAVITRASDGQEVDPMSDAEMYVPVIAIKRKHRIASDTAPSTWLGFDINGYDGQAMCSADLREKTTVAYDSKVLELLLAPPEEHDAVFPVIDHPDVHWFAPRNMVYDWWFDAARQQWRRNTRRV